MNFTGLNGKGNALGHHKYIFGGNTGLTQNDLQRKRQALQGLAYSNARRAPSNFGEGLNAIGNALAWRMGNADVQRQEQAGKQQFSALQQAFMQKLQGGGSAGGMNPAQQDAANRLRGVPAPKQPPAQAGGGYDLQSAIMEASGLAANPFASPGQKAQLTALQQLMMQRYGLDHKARLASSNREAEFEDWQRREQWKLDNRGPQDRKVIKGADGFNYWQDTGERVLPGVEKQPDALKQAQIALARGKLANMGGPDFDTEQKLRKEFGAHKGVESFRKVHDAWGRVQASQQTPAGDLALIFNFMKMLDPGSVVREGEFATAQNATGVPERVYNLYNRALTGERLNSEQRKQFVAQARDLYNSNLTTRNSVAEQYRGLAQEYNLPPDRIAQMIALAEEQAAPGVSEEDRLREQLRLGPKPGVPVQIGDSEFSWY